jgi:hypothetical protein
MLIPVVIKNANVVDEAFDFPEDVVEDFLEHSLCLGGAVSKAHR